MDSALQKALGELLLNAVPTILIFLGLVITFHYMVYLPLQKVLAERHARTAGAVEKAKADIAAAEQKTAEYEQALREARAGQFKQQEARRKSALEAREKALAQAREQASGMVKSAKAEIGKEAATAKAGLEAQVEVLAQQVIQRVLGTAAGR